MKDFFCTMQFAERQPKVSFPSEKRALLLLNEREVINHSMDAEGGETDIPSYEYDGVFLNVTNPTENAVLNEVKHRVHTYLDEYDKSSKVNRFTYKGKSMWLDKVTRNGLIMRLTAEKNEGCETTTLWYSETDNKWNFTLPISEAFAILYKIENYASQCYDNTQRHHKTITGLATIEEVVDYDFTTGYPEILVFE